MHVHVFGIKKKLLCRLTDKLTQSFVFFNVWTFINDCKDNFLVDKDIELFWSISDREESTWVFSCESDSEEQDSYGYFNSGKIQVARKLSVSIEEFHEKLVSLLEDYMWNISVLF